jgi:hypothetical protein
LNSNMRSFPTPSHLQENQHLWTKIKTFCTSYCMYASNFNISLLWFHVGFKLWSNV